MTRSRGFRVFLREDELLAVLEAIEFRVVGEHDDELVSRVPALERAKTKLAWFADGRSQAL